MFRLTELDLIVDSSIGALFFVSGSISVFVVLAILVLKKGTDAHNIMGYLYFFGLGFTNYASAMAYYEGLLPSSAVMISVPLSSVFLILGIVSIISKTKSKLRIQLHIVSMLITTAAFSFGIVSQWYHFKVSLLNVFQWSDFQQVLTLSLPILPIGVLLALHFFKDIENILLSYSVAELSLEEKAAGEIKIEIETQEVRSRQNLDVIYQEGKQEEEDLEEQENHEEKESQIAHRG